MTQHLHDSRETGESCLVGKKVTYFEEFSYLNSSRIKKSITLMFMSSSRNKFELLFGFRPADAHPDGHQHGVPIQISLNLGKAFLRCLYHLTKYQRTGKKPW